MKLTFCQCKSHINHKSIQKPFHISMIFLTREIIYKFIPVKLVKKWSYWFSYLQYQHAYAGQLNFRINCNGYNNVERIVDVQYNVYLSQYISLFQVYFLFVHYWYIMLVINNSLSCLIHSIFYLLTLKKMLNVSSQLNKHSNQRHRSTQMRPWPSKYVLLKIQRLVVVVRKPMGDIALYESCSATWLLVGICTNVLNIISCNYHYSNHLHINIFLYKRRWS